MAAPPTLDEVHPSWRDIYPVHPCADVFPRMSDEDIERLAADIKQNGLREPVVQWRNPNNHQLYILDGRNRLDALERIGINLATPEIEIFETREIADPAAFVISTNIRRRHLTKTEQAELIVAALDAAKSVLSITENGNAAIMNDRATSARSFNPTKGQRGGSTKDPDLEAAVEEGRKHGISKRTIQDARAKRRGRTPRPRRTQTDFSRTVPTGEATAVETWEPSTTEAAISKKIAAAMQEVELGIQRALKRWPFGTSLMPLILFLQTEADHLVGRDETTQEHVDPLPPAA